jgi:glucose-6-phosphate 1-dehydrogenase
LPVTATEVFVRFRRPPSLYPATAKPPNHIRFRISPDVGIALATLVKEPGEELKGRPAELLAVHHADSEEMAAYERLLGDAMKGNATEFAREDYVEEAWRIVEPVLDNAVPVSEYDPHTWGPDTTGLITGDGPWHDPVDVPAN